MSFFIYLFIYFTSNVTLDIRYSDSKLFQMCKVERPGIKYRINIGYCTTVLIGENYYILAHREIIF